MMVYTAGDGTHGFTLDPSVGEFLLSHPNMRVPEKGHIYSVNEAYSHTWSDAVKKYVSECKRSEERGDKRSSLRYIGSLVSDVHRTLMYGGIFLYPPDAKNPGGKLRLLYEANPIAFIMEEAGGMATNGEKRVMEVEPLDGIHTRTPLYVGSKANVEFLMKCLREFK